MLIVNNVEAGYHGKPILDIKNISLSKGESLLIRGQSGSGKTTLLNVIAGLHKPNKGKVCINETVIYELAEPSRDKFRGQHIGLVFQTLHLIKSLNVVENVLLGSYAQNKSQDTKLALDLLERVGIADLAHKNSSEISQGQAQRVAIARALINRPVLLLADEPTSSLDNKSTDGVIDLLKSLSSEAGTSLLITSHDDRLKNHFSNSLEIGV